MTSTTFKKGAPGLGIGKISQNDAIYQALEEIGDQTSLETLQVAASKFYGKPICSTTACTARSLWRRKRGIHRDNRIYPGQPKRDMVKEGKLNVDQLRRMIDFIKHPGETKPALAKLLSKGAGEFQNLEQLKRALQVVEELQF